MTNGTPPFRADESRYRSIEITDDYMFMTVLCQHPEICVSLLRAMLPDININHVEYKRLDEMVVGSNQPNIQQTIPPGTDARGVRLDVFYDDGAHMFDVEMHNGRNGKDLDLPKRTRYAHSAIDVTALKHSEGYGKLRPCYVIYICTFDPFGKGLTRYTVRNQIAEDPNIEYNDEAYTLFFNAKGTRGEASDAMREILSYIKDPRSYPIDRTDIDVIKRIDEAVRFNQHSPDWRLGYDMMFLSQYDAEQRGMRRGIEQGIERGIEQGLAQGIERGIEQGIERGIEQGIERGLALGAKENQRNTVLRMLKRNKPLEEIAEDTGLTLEEVHSIKSGQSSIA
ncbi:MAG: Rpn family recombination-promoting nuclease/putative transposase [Oscillospiraceae bacterium]|jgi:predicted transposase/invertase (TIGR01784 family)|nr:Rpn family recombination-promoting nuclease/putative transposase [Oscillospiraceae bacterium]